MSDTRDEQPAVGRWAKCIHCGARSVLLLCEKCAAQATEEHVARQRALKENGRLRTERLAREAADGVATASPAPSAAFASSAWLGELEAALTLTQKVLNTLYTQRRLAAWVDVAEARDRLLRALETERRHSPNSVLNKPESDKQEDIHE